MNVAEVAAYFAGLPDQSLPVCTVNQHGDATEVTSIKLAAAEPSKQFSVNDKLRIELE